MPPQPSIQSKAKVLGGRAVRDGTTGHSDSPWRNGAGACEKYNLGLDRVEGETAGRPPIHQTVHSMLNLRKQSRGIRTPAKDSTVISKCHPEGIVSVDEADCIIKGQRPEAGRANPPP